MSPTRSGENGILLQPLERPSWQGHRAINSKKECKHAGLIDSYLYHSGRIDTTLPYDELRRRSLVNEAAQTADDAPDFSQRIRGSLPRCLARTFPSAIRVLTAISNLQVKKLEEGPWVPYSAW